MLQRSDKINQMIIKSFGNTAFYDFPNNRKERDRSVFSASSLESFLCIGVTSADFHSEGRRPWPSEVLNNAQRLGAICWLHSFKRRAGIPSGPHAFEVSRLLRHSFTSSTQISNSASEVTDSGELNSLS